MLTNGGGITVTIGIIGKEHKLGTPRPEILPAGGDLASKTDPTTGIEHPQSTSYEARVPLDDKDGLLRLGMRGRGKIHVQWVSLGSRLWRFVIHTFNFKL